MRCSLYSQNIEKRRNCRIRFVADVGCLHYDKFMSQIFKNRIVSVIVLLVILSGSDSLYAQWQNDVDKAAQVALKDGKDILLLFTGAPWDKFSENLETEVLSKEDFITEISGDFVLVKMDFPKVKDPRADEQPRYKWAERYGVTTYPTVVLVDATMKPFAITGYEAGGVQNYLGKLSEYRRARQIRDDNLAKAAKAKGAEKAKYLDKALSGMDEIIVPIYYADEIEQIVKLDADDKLGLRSKWNAEEDAEMRKIIMTDLMLVARVEKPENAVKLIDQVMAEIAFPIEQKLEVLQIKLGVIKKMDDPDAIDAVMEEMINLEGVEGDTKERLMVRKIMLMVGGGRKEAAMDLLDSSLQAGMAKGDRNLFFWAAKGDLLMAEKKYKEALAAFEKAIPMADREPDVLIELVSGQADALYALERQAEALQTLDNFAEDTRLPADLRAEATLQKSMIMRLMGKTRLARLSENRAIEIANTPELKGEFQKVIQRLRQKYEGAN